MKRGVATGRKTLLNRLKSVDDGKFVDVSAGDGYMTWNQYDPDWLVQLAQKQFPELTWLPGAFEKCQKYRSISRAYVYFVDPTNPNKPSSEWQFEKNIFLASPKHGEIVVDVFTNHRIGGIEFLNRL